MFKMTGSAVQDQGCTSRGANRASVCRPSSNLVRHRLNHNFKEKSRRLK
jgi:hypothetical protein